MPSVLLILASYSRVRWNQLPKKMSKSPSWHGWLSLGWLATHLWALSEPSGLSNFEMAAHYVDQVASHPQTPACLCLLSVQPRSRRSNCTSKDTYLWEPIPDGRALILLKRRSSHVRLGSSWKKSFGISLSKFLCRCNCFHRRRPEDALSASEI